MAKLIFQIDGLTQRRSKKLRRFLSKKTSAKPWKWVIICGLVIYALSLFPTDLSGRWVRSDGSIVQIIQHGNEIKAEFIKVRPSLKQYGFSIGDEHFAGILDGKTVHGKMHVHFPLSLKSKCPEKWSRLDDIKLTVSGTNNRISGKWKRIKVSEESCEKTAESWEPIYYTRFSLSDVFKKMLIRR